MSWSVSSSGTPAEVRRVLSEQFKGPLAEPPGGLSDNGERVTVAHVVDLCEQVLVTFDPAIGIIIKASGHMRFDDYVNKTGCRQQVDISITPEE